MKTISYTDYLAFRTEYFNNPNGQRFGQAFCNKFNISDNVLFYQENATKAEGIIYADHVQF